MATLKKRPGFFDSSQATEIKAVLRDMVLNATYDTRSTYTTNSTEYPNNRIPFVEKHLNYISVHPNLDVHQYLANLRLVTRIR